METLHKPEHHLQSGKNFNKPHRSITKPLHHHWGFWLGVVLISVALVIYITSIDFTIQPTIQQTIKNN